MSNTITKTVLNDGPRTHIVEMRITGDGSGQETATSLIDVSAIGGAPSSVVIEKVYWSLQGFSTTLLWDATTDTVAIECGEGEGGIDFSDIGGPLRNTAGTGKTGDLQFTTVGLGATGKGYIRVQARKKYA